MQQVAWDRDILRMTMDTHSLASVKGVREMGRESWGKWELDKVIKSRWSSRDGEVRNSISVGGA